MENKNSYKEKRFDSYLNKIIKFSAKGYFKKQMSIINKERTIVNDEDYYAFLQGFIVSDNAFSTVENTLELNTALQSLTDIEQSVIFLLFKEELSEDEAAKILQICYKSVSRIKLRAISKLRKYLEGDLKNEK